MLSINIRKLIIFTWLAVCLLAEVHSMSTNGTDAAEDRAFKAEEVGIQGRTFGAIKRFQSALLPIMYKLGVMSAVIMMTLFLAFKSVFIGTLILVLNITFFALKFGSFLKHDHGHYISHAHGWAPQIHHDHGWTSPHKDVHLHIHNGHGKPDFSIPYSTLSGVHGWDTQGHSSAVEPSWTSNNYVHSGRGFSDNDLTPYSSNVLDEVNKLNTNKAKLIERRSDKEPTIVMANTKQIIHAVTPYNYLNKQNRK